MQFRELDELGQFEQVVGVSFGLGGFVDGILLHQIIRWHNMLSAVVPPVTIDAMHVNMLADGIAKAFER